jgi:hypothetical protein
MPNSKQLSLILNKVEKWLKDEVIHNQSIVGSEEVYYREEKGRMECAEGLLEMIAQWRKEYDDLDVPKTMTLAELSEERRKNPEKYLSQYTLDEMKKLGLPIRKEKSNG